MFRKIYVAQIHYLPITESENKPLIPYIGFLVIFGIFGGAYLAPFTI